MSWSHYGAYSKIILYLMEDSKRRKIHCFLLKNWVSPIILAQLSFSLNNTEKKLYANVPEIINFNSKTSIQKYPIFCSCYNVSSANVSDFYRSFTGKN